jgi:hypothetical protein
MVSLTQSSKEPSTTPLSLSNISSNLTSFRDLTAEQIFEDLRQL